MNYKNSRDAAWQLLIKNKVAELPISVNKICRAEHVRLFTYAQAGKLARKLNLERYMEGNDAFTFAKMVFFDNTTPTTRQRFSVAHELGHIVLHDTTAPTVYNREISPSDSPIEAEANVFASRLLAPMCVLHYLGVSSPEEIAELCHISQAAAEIRYKRLRLIRERDESMLRARGYGCFLLSPLERKVFENFKKYIEKNRR